MEIVDVKFKDSPDRMSRRHGTNTVHGCRRVDKWNDFSIR